MIDVDALRDEIMAAAIGSPSLPVATKLVAMKVLSAWIKLANKRLTTGKREYISALGIRKISRGEWQVFLGGQNALPWMLEFGTTGAEINKGMRAAAQKAGGYINVPMQHKAGSLGLAPHGRRAAAVLAPKLDNAVKASKQMSQLVARGQRRGKHSRFSNMPAAEGSGHTTSVTSALRRLITGAQKVTHAKTGNTYYRAVNKYMTWRRFGANSTWNFKGFQASNLAQQVVAGMGPLVDSI